MGRPKALIAVEGEALIERTAAVAATVSDKIVLLGRPPFEMPSGISSLPILEDLHPGIGPMAGLESLLCSRRGEACILLACDLPHLSGVLLQRLCASPGGDDAAVVCTRDGRVRHWHPCCAVYRPSTLPAVQAAVAAGQHGMIKLLANLRVHPVEIESDEARWVENWNEPDDVPPASKRPGNMGEP